MGACISKLFESMTQIVAKDKPFVYCCSNHRATYRCQANIALSLGEINESVFRKLRYNMKPEFQKALLRLRPYLKSYSNDIVTWIACDQCISDCVEDYFAHIPGGWKETSHLEPYEIVYLTIN